VLQYMSALLIWVSTYAGNGFYGQLVRSLNSELAGCSACGKYVRVRQLPSAFPVQRTCRL
jgi:hypothetical protein